MNTESNPPIDFLRLAINLGGNKAVIEEMLTLFLKTTAASLETLERVAHESNADLWKQTLHQIKGAAKNIAAKRLAALATEAETIQHLPHADAAAAIGELQKEHELLRDTITSYLHSH